APEFENQSTSNSAFDGSVLGPAFGGASVPASRFEKGSALPTKGKAREDARSTSASLGNKGNTDTVGPQLRRFRPALRVQIEFRENRPALVVGSEMKAVVAEARGPF